MSQIAGRVVLRKGRAGPVWAGHPWVFSGAVQTVKGNPEHGDLVQVADPLGNTIGQGHYSKDAHIAVRMVSLGEEAIREEAFLQSRIVKAIGARKALGLPSEHTTAFRLIASDCSNCMHDLHGRSVPKMSPPDTSRKSDPSEKSLKHLQLRTFSEQDLHDRL